MPLPLFIHPLLCLVALCIYIHIIDKSHRFIYSFIRYYRRLGSEGVRGLSLGSRDPVRCMGIEDSTGDDGCPGGVEGPGGVEDPGGAVLSVVLVVLDDSEERKSSTSSPMFFTSSA